MGHIDQSTWRLLCSSYLGSILQSLYKKKAGHYQEGTTYKSPGSCGFCRQIEMALKSSKSKPVGGTRMRCVAAVQHRAGGSLQCQKPSLYATLTLRFTPEVGSAALN